MPTTLKVEFLCGMQPGFCAAKRKQTLKVLWKIYSMNQDKFNDLSFDYVLDL